MEHRAIGLLELTTCDLCETTISVGSAIACGPSLPQSAVTSSFPVQATFYMYRSATAFLGSFVPSRSLRRSVPPSNSRCYQPTLSPAKAVVSSNLSETAMNFIDTRSFLASRVADAIANAYGADVDSDPKLTPATRPKFGDYQCNAAMSLCKKLRSPPAAVAAKLVEHLDVSDVCLEPEIKAPGFINLTLSDEFVYSKLNAMLADPSRLGVPERSPKKRIVVDFSSPNIAKDMHVGHLRSTIIGDSLARTLEFLGHETIRLNHTGDWGTQFGQLIAYMKSECPELLLSADDASSKPSTTEIGSLVEFYRKAKKRFDEDPDFKQTALREVVQLQNGSPESLRAWNLICDLSRIEFTKIYDRLDIRLEERGESFYNPFLKDIVHDLEQKAISTKNDGATVVFLEGKEFKGRDGDPLPVIVQKSDGGFLYATTDLAAIRYRSGVDMAERIIYVTDIGQSLHFQQIFAVARKANLLPSHVTLEHVPFGLVQGADGKKFKTRAGAAPKLSDLLNEARDRVRLELERRAVEEASRAQKAGEQPPEPRTNEELEEMSEIIGVAAVKYADLKNNRTSNYKFSFDKMVKLEGDTAPYIMYAFARVQGIYRTAAAASGATAEDLSAGLSFSFEKPEERALSKMLLRLPEVLAELERDLLPHVLCEYVYSLTSRFNQFYEQCPVVHAEALEVRRSRLGLCRLSASTLKLCLGLLGIPTLDQI